MRVCVCVCVRACVRACVCVCFFFSNGDGRRGLGWTQRLVWTTTTKSRQVYEDCLGGRLNLPNGETSPHVQYKDKAANNDKLSQAVPVVGPVSHADCRAE